MAVQWSGEPIQRDRLVRVLCLVAFTLAILGLAEMDQGDRIDEGRAPVAHVCEVG